MCGVNYFCRSADLIVTAQLDPHSDEHTPGSGRSLPEPSQICASYVDVREHGQPSGSELLDGSRGSANALISCERKPLGNGLPQLTARYNFRNVSCVRSSAVSRSRPSVCVKRQDLRPGAAAIAPAAPSYSANPRTMRSRTAFCAAVSMNRRNGATRRCLPKDDRLHPQRCRQAVAAGVEAPGSLGPGGFFVPGSASRKATAQPMRVRNTILLSRNCPRDCP